MTVPSSALADRWAAAAVALGAPAPAAAAAGRLLAEQYDAPPRWYHSADHACRVADVADALVADLPLPAPQRRALAAAALAHDAVYEGRPGEDEDASAGLARRLLLEAGADPASAEEVARLVRTTSTHRVDPTDTAGAALADADLSVLGGLPVEYDGYVAQVREEYAHIDDDRWRAGRSAVLADLLARPALFVTRTGRARWEQHARANLQRELAALQG